MPTDRYQRQTLLPQIGAEGQAKLAKSRVLLVGCGALGTHSAEQLARAGVGFLRIVDRDIVEWTNLQRQVLFDEEDARRAWPKAAAAGERLAKINSSIIVEPRVVDLHGDNAEELAADVDLILDGTDNVATRYLLNDLAVKLNKPWVYAACVATEGRVMAVRPGMTACLRCVFPTPPAAEMLPTCDTAGVLAAAASVAASMQVVETIRLLLDDPPEPRLYQFNVWTQRFSHVSLESSRSDACPCCAKRDFEFLRRLPTSASLCGRDAVQIHGERKLDLKSVSTNWVGIGEVEKNRYFVRCRLSEPAGLTLTAFEDGRVIVQGTKDIGRARAMVARFIGA